MLKYTKEDLENATYGVRLAIVALSDNPATYPKEDIERIRRLARDGLKIARDLLDGLDAEGYFDHE